MAPGYRPHLAPPCAKLIRLHWRGCAANGSNRSPAPAVVPGDPGDDEVLGRPEPVRDDRCSAGAGVGRVGGSLQSSGRSFGHRVLAFGGAGSGFPEPRGSCAAGVSRCSPRAGGGSSTPKGAPSRTLPPSCLAASRIDGLQRPARPHRLRRDLQTAPAAATAPQTRSWRQGTQEAAVTACAGDDLAAVQRPLSLPLGHDRTDGRLPAPAGLVLRGLRLSEGFRCSMFAALGTAQPCPDRILLGRQSCSQSSRRS